MLITGLSNIPNSPPPVLLNSPEAATITEDYRNEVIHSNGFLVAMMGIGLTFSGTVLYIYFFSDTCQRDEDIERDERDEERIRGRSQRRTYATSIAIAPEPTVYRAQHMAAPIIQPQPQPQSQSQIQSILKAPRAPVPYPQPYTQPQIYGPVYGYYSDIYKKAIAQRYPTHPRSIA